MSRRELFASLCAIVFLVNLSRVVFAPLVQPVAADFDVPAASLGLVTSAVWLGSAAPRLPTGYLLTRVPRHFVVAGTGALLVFTAGFTAFTESLTQLALGAFLMGLSSGIYFIAANPLISELFPSGVGRMLGIHGMSSQLAAVGAPLIVGIILIVTEWRTSFLLISAMAAIATVALVWAAIRTPLPRAGEADRSLFAAGRVQWPIILTGILIMGTTGFLWNALFNLYGDYLEVVKGIDPSTGRLLLSLMFAAGVPAFLVAGRMADRLPSVPMLLIIAAVATIGVLSLTVVEGVLLIAVCSLIAGYAFHSLIPTMDTYLLASLPDQHRGSAYALYSASMMVMISLGSGTVGTLVTYGFAYNVVFRTIGVILGGLILTVAVLYWRGNVPTGGIVVD